MTAVHLNAAFQREIFAELVPESGLLVLARGLGLFEIVKAFVELYASPKLLVFLLGASVEQEEVLMKLFTAGEEELIGHVPFKVVKNDTMAKQRVEMYLRGGVISITSRIMLIDLLKGRIPSHLATGILLIGAERVTEYSPEAFSIDLYRSQNSVGFIKSFCERAEAMTGGFAKIEKTMKFLKIPKLFLYPRFHATVKGDLDAVQMQVEEVYISMTPRMKMIQLGLLEMLESCLNELLKANPALDLREFNMETAITSSFDQQIRRQLDPVWHRVSMKSKQLVGELKTLRCLLEYLVEFDSITFCKFLETLIIADAASCAAGGFRSYWLLLDTAQSVIKTAKDRVFREEKDGQTAQNVERIPKWRVLEMNLQRAGVGGDEQDGGGEGGKTLIIVRREHTKRQITSFLAAGYEEWCGKRYREFAEWRQSVRLQAGLDLGIAIREPLQREDVLGKRRTRQGFFGRVAEERLAGKRREEEERGEGQGGEGENDVDDRKSPDGIGGEPEAFDETVGKRGILVVVYGETEEYADLLLEHAPGRVVMYDPDLAFIRALEMYCAARPKPEPRITTLIYKESVEEQLQLLLIRQEKNAFEHLIRTRASMAGQVAETEGERRTGTGGVEESTESLTRFSGTAEKVARSVVVDMRELRSSLPFILYKHGFSLEPRTIEVGDYVLTPEVCVERKSTSDLISSLNSGRLYAQVEQMMRHYATPVLLIEFDERKPFSLLASTELRSEISISEVSSKLCLLLLHFPKLKIMWSSSLAATAEMFLDLKRGQDEPRGLSGREGEDGDGEMGAEGETGDPVALDMLLSLPGITPRNCQVVARHVRDMRALCDCSLEDLQKLLGGESARQLHAFLHARAGQK